jgi:prolyl-tRNA editing enzyme YbaK/EbsC (Cys-tRNA(Pro) deacylase)
MDDIEAKVRAILAATGFAHELIPCDPDLADTARFVEAYGYALDESANTIVVASRKPEGLVAVCVVLADSRLDVNGVVRRRLGARKVSFASAELTVELTGMMIGGVTPFGLPEDLPLWIDTRVIDRDQVILGGGSRSLKVQVDPSVLVALGGEVVEGLAKPTGA